MRALSQCSHNVYHVGRLGEALGNVSMLANVTLGQLIEEAPVRWPTIWDESVERTICLVLLPRKSRPEM